MKENWKQWKDTNVHVQLSGSLLKVLLPFPPQAEQPEYDFSGIFWQMKIGYSFLHLQMSSVQWHLWKLLSFTHNVNTSTSLLPLFKYWNIMDSTKHTAAMGLFWFMISTDAFQDCINRQNCWDNFSTHFHPSITTCFLPSLFSWSHYLDGSYTAKEPRQERLQMSTAWRKGLL